MRGFVLNDISEDELIESFLIGDIAQIIKNGIVNKYNEQYTNWRFKREDGIIQEFSYHRDTGYLSLFLYVPNATDKIAVYEYYFEKRNNAKRYKLKCDTDSDLYYKVIEMISLENVLGNVDKRGKFILHTIPESDMVKITKEKRERLRKYLDKVNEKKVSK